ARTSRPSRAIARMSRRTVISVVPSIVAMSATEITPRVRRFSAILRRRSTASIRAIVRDRSDSIKSETARLTKLTESVIVRGWSNRQPLVGALSPRKTGRSRGVACRSPGGFGMGRSKIEVPYTDIKLPLDLDLTRRDVLKIAGYGSLAAFIAACGGNPSSSGNTSITATGGKLAIGSYQSDSVPKKALADLVNNFASSNGGTKVTINTVDHGTFQNQITSYLQGTPEDVF